MVRIQASDAAVCKVGRGASKRCPAASSASCGFLGGTARMLTPFVRQLIELLEGVGVVRRDPAQAGRHPAREPGASSRPADKAKKSGKNMLISFCSLMGVNAQTERFIAPEGITFFPDYSEILAGSKGGRRRKRTSGIFFRRKRKPPGRLRLGRLKNLSAVFAADVHGVLRNSSAAPRVRTAARQGEPGALYLLRLGKQGFLTGGRSPPARRGGAFPVGNRTEGQISR